MKDVQLEEIEVEGAVEEDLLREEPDQLLERVKEEREEPDQLLDHIKEEPGDLVELKEEKIKFQY